MTAPQTPCTTWEFSVSAAEELVVWHLDLGREPQPMGRETIVLLAAAVHALATTSALAGPEVASLPLAAPAGQDGLLGMLRDHALSALQSSPAEVLAGVEREQLLAAYGTEQWADMLTAAQAVLHHHVQDAAGEGCPHPTIRDRAPAMARARRQRMLTDLEGIEGEQW
ncbi:hypothetical protein AB0942_33940 [Streptomyces nodosus]|uniref:hypothetical protein n=1 Tax=Streptomyces nodosus TaxID=40318 RepID=UPI003453C132